MKYLIFLHSIKVFNLTLLILLRVCLFSALTIRLFC